LALPTTARPDPSFTSHDQPEPNWFTPVSLTLAWKSEKEPKAASIALASSPSGSPPPSGAMFSQNIVWL